MDFEFTPEQKAFAAEVTEFLDANDDPEVFDVSRENMAQIVDTPKRRAIHEKARTQSWLGITWPEEYGGSEAKASTSTSSTNNSLAAVDPKSAKASASSGRP